MGVFGGGGAGVSKDNPPAPAFLGSLVIPSVVRGQEIKKTFWVEGRDGMISLD